MEVIALHKILGSALSHTLVVERIY